MKRSYYENHLYNFLEDTENSILGELTKHHEFDLIDLQRNAWIFQIRILKEQFISCKDDIYLFFEYAIPRMGKRVDVILLYKGAVFVIEFKVGENKFTNHALDQVLDYSLDLKNFHEQSHNKYIVPIVVATEAKPVSNCINLYKDLVYSPIKTNKDNLYKNFEEISASLSEKNMDYVLWSNSLYKPTPTIIEAAQTLYRGHNVADISRSDSGAINLSKTSDAISRIIEISKKNNYKSICFITGVPGSGKTLAGLNIANGRNNISNDEHAVFLSGNGPLVTVLQEALARNEVIDKKSIKESITKIKSLTKTKAFIQNIHHFRDDAIHSNQAPVEKVVIFDEAQRAWTFEQTNDFMNRKKGISDFNMSEPEFLISVLDKHIDWATIICLIGGGQEINTGEAGLPEWFLALKNKFPHWHVYVSDKLSEYEYNNGTKIYFNIDPSKLHIQNELHLSVSIRSFRSEKVSELIKEVLDNNKEKAKTIYEEIKYLYPIYVTRDIVTAKQWLKEKARGSERIGLITSSGSYRLRPFGINVKSKVDPANWFLNGKEDIRSSYFLEEVATEFDIQGLELDWTCVAWDADLRYYSHQWQYRKFRGTSWQNINDEQRKRYLLNAYRVLLTRARQGFIVFIPEGDNEDFTRLKEFYDPTYNYLKAIGLNCI